MKPASTLESETRAASQPGPLAIQTILVPIDFSEPTVAAVHCAVGLARHFQACIHLLHVCAEGEDPQTSGAADQMLQFAEVVTFLQTSACNIHENAPECVWPKNCHLRSGKPYQAICATAQEIDADLIVMPTRGQTGLKQMLLGRTTARVIKHARRPVLVLRLDSATAEISFRNILVPIDFSEAAKTSFKYGLLLAASFGARLCLIHVARRIRASTEEESHDLEDSYRESSKQGLKLLQREAALKDITCDTLFLEGKPADEVVAAGKRRDSDLIVLTTHGETDGPRELMGNTAEAIARHASTSVLVVPSYGFRPKSA